MGFLAALPAVIGSGLSAIGGGSALAGALTVGGLAKSIIGGSGGGSKPPPVIAAPPPPPQQAAAPAAPNAVQPTSASRNRALAALSPGLALAGVTSSPFTASNSRSSGGKTLLGQ
jgi:hypothetical protein